MSKLIFLSFIWLLLVSVKVNGDTECFSSRTDFYNFFSTKTSYFSVVNNNQTFDDIQFEGKFCCFVQVKYSKCSFSIQIIKTDSYIHWLLITNYNDIILLIIK